MALGLIVGCRVGVVVGVLLGFAVAVALGWGGGVADTFTIADRVGVTVEPQPVTSVPPKTSKKAARYRIKYPSTVNPAP